MSQSLHGSAGLGHHESVSGDRFPYHRDSTLECHEPSRFQWFGPEDGPRDDLDDPRDGDNVTTMSNSGSYLVTLVALQPYSSTPVALNYSSHSRADMPLLSTTLGLSSVCLLPHLAVYPALT